MACIAAALLTRGRDGKGRFAWQLMGGWLFKVVTCSVLAAKARESRMQHCCSMNMRPAFIQAVDDELSAATEPCAHYQARPKSSENRNSCAQRSRHHHYDF